jgi:hypothetical protein
MKQTSGFKVEVAEENFLFFFRIKTTTKLISLLETFLHFILFFLILKIERKIKKKKIIRFDFYLNFFLLRYIASLFVFLLCKRIIIIIIIKML